MSDQLWIATVIFGALCFIIWIAFRTPEEQGKPPAHSEVAQQATSDNPVERQPNAGGAWTALWLLPWALGVGENGDRENNENEKR